MHTKYKDIIEKNKEIISEWSKLNAKLNREGILPDIALFELEVYTEFVMYRDEYNYKIKEIAEILSTKGKFKNHTYWNLRRIYFKLNANVK